MSSKRLITVVLEIQDQDLITPIWDAYLEGLQFNGCRIKSISNGDFLAQLNYLENQLGTLREDRDL